MTEEVAKLEARLAELGTKREENLKQIKVLGAEKQLALEVVQKTGLAMKSLSQENQAIDKEAQELLAKIPPPEAA